MENNGEMSWVDKVSVISIERLCVKSTVFVRPRIDNYSHKAVKKEAKITIEEK